MLPVTGAVSWTVLTVHILGSQVFGLAFWQPSKVRLYSFKFNVVLCIGESMFVDGEFLNKCLPLDCCSFTFGTIE